MTPDELQKLCDSQRGNAKTREAKATFLQALAANGGVMVRAAKAAGFSPRTAYNWQQECKTFTEAVEAVRDSTDGEMRDEQPNAATLRPKPESHDDYIEPNYREQVSSVCKDIKSSDGQRRTVKAKRKFLRSYYANNGNATAAARQIGKSPRIVRHWQQHDSKFASLMDEIGEIIKAELTGVLVDEFKRGNAKVLPLVARGILGWNDDSKTQVNITNRVLNPDKSHQEKLARAKEVMDAIGYAVVDTAKPKIEQIN